MLLNKEGGWRRGGVRGVDAEQQISLPVLGPNALVPVLLVMKSKLSNVLFLNDTPFVFLQINAKGSCRSFTPRMKMGRRFLNMELNS